MSQKIRGGSGAVFEIACHIYKKILKKSYYEVLSKLGLGPMSTEIIDIVSDFAKFNKKRHNVYSNQKSN